MKAAYFNECGGPEVMRYGDVPDPVAQPGEVLVDVHAASVNGADPKVRAGKSGKISTFPYVPGRDFSGVVSALGAGVSGWQVGDPVFGVCDNGIEGAYAEKITIRADIVARKPDALSHVECAALGLVGLTAIISIEDTIKLQRGETILVTGGAGGVAGFAVQLAKHLGARVISTTSAKNVDYVKGLGADQIIDYNAQDFAQVLSGLDAVFDTVGGKGVEGCFSVLRAGGRAAFIASGYPGPKSPRADATALRPAVGRDRPHLERMTSLVTSGAVKVPEIKVYSLAEAAAAHVVSDGRHFRGKLVFKVR